LIKNYKRLYYHKPLALSLIKYNSLPRASEILTRFEEASW
jgi:hypothetical protein